MIRKMYFLVLILLVFGMYPSNSQGIPTHHRAAIKRHIAKGQKSFLAKDFAEAVKQFVLVDSLAPGIAEVECNIGICMLSSRHKARSLTYFLKAKKNGYNLNDIHFYLGRAFHYNYQFDSSKKAYQEYLRLIEIDSTGELETPTQIKRRIEICDNANQQIEDSLFVSIENIGPNINTNYDEYVPILSADEKLIYFTSRRPTEFNDELYKDGMHYEDIHHASKDSTGKWQQAVAAEYPLNMADHDACIGISSDSKTLFLFRALKENPALGNIYESKFVNRKWTAPTKLGSNINSTRGWESSITISGDSKRLYFSSDRPGGYGGFDIWFCDLLPNNTWGTPKNLGPEINTKYNEDCPFIHFDNITLFFSSDGHNTMGGYDVFSSVYFADKDKWTKPINIGYPINSVDDDMYFIYSSDGSKGYMSSSMRKDTKGGNDIYIIHRPYHSHRILTLRGKLLNSENDLPIGAKITVTDMETKEVIGIFDADSVTGKYLVQVEKGKNYSMQFESEDMLLGSENIKIDDPEAIFAEKKSFVLKPIKKGQTIALKNIFFDYNNYDLKQESNNELEKLITFLKKNANVKIQINGYSDTVGNELYNLRLSKKRANEVRNHLVTNGVAGNRIRIQGFGEAKSKSVDSASAQGSRHTEFEVFDIDTLTGEKKLILSKADSVNSDDVLLEGIFDEKKIGTLAHQYALFNYNDGLELNEFSKKQMAHIVAVMKRIPKLKLKVIGNLEVAGKEYNNMSLYDARVNSVINYFTSQGIFPERLVVNGFVPTKKPKQPKLDKTKQDGRSVKFSLLDI
jgi:outer membrane protein OmpA-like peptidoglycan-associated protein